MNSLGGAATPSPEQSIGARGGVDQDLQVRTLRDLGGQVPHPDWQKWHVLDAVDYVSYGSTELPLQLMLTPP